MEDPQAAYYPPYAFDLDLMKRSMDPLASAPDAKKARWSPSAGMQQQQHSPNSPHHPADPYANYGYGQQSQLYSTPANLTINTQQHQQQQAQNGMIHPGQGSPNSALFNAQQNGYNAYNMFSMNGMNMLAANGFNPYNAAAANGFQQQQVQQQQQQQQAQQQQQQSRVPSININVPAAQSAYSPAMSATGMPPSNASPPSGRTVYIGNLPPTASVDELLNLVHFGPLESIRVLPEKSCVFLSFLDAATAAAFHADATVKKLTLHSQELKVGWGKPSPVPAQVQLAITQSNASRNVYLGGLDEGMTEEMLRDDLSRFGLIDQVKIVRDKNIGFIHFLSISVATKVVNTLPTEPAWAGKRVNYGKDRCAYIPKSQQAAAQQAQAAAAQSLVAQSSAPPMSPFLGGGANGGGFSGYPFSPMLDVNMGMGLANTMQGMNRTVYLGNIHPETTTEDLCNAIRGGVLQSIRFMQDKHIAFVTFIDPAAAFTFFQVASYQGMTLNNRRLKIGWGKNSGPLAPTLALAVHGGATRNVYIGNVEDFDDQWTDERLKRDFGEYGDIELVNFLKEKNCAFVNFTNISNAIKAIEGIKSKPDYANLRIAHGKDRCANPPRSGPQGGRRSGGGNSPRNGNRDKDMNGGAKTEFDDGGMAMVPEEDGVEDDGALPEFTVQDMRVDGGMANVPSIITA